ncbi:hypothetical protein AS156_05260 [Bradyrhizobium macuxiense]|uniref:Transposase IS166 family protein n=1 Tax=Bradyrhizobium macuxiense TaxID=1755647 RepID=A0A109JVQ1_9BRAD|nr:hypothetical protein AS156_05260 [Bradyrhizobium macuxiense]
MILAERAARLAADAKLAEATNAQAKQSSTEALIAHLKLEIETLKRTLYGTRSERSARGHSISPARSMLFFARNGIPILDNF